MKNAVGFCLLAALTGAAPAMAQTWGQPAPSASPSAVPSAVPSALPSAEPSQTDCAVLTELSARLACLKTRVQRQEAGLLPDVLAFLATSPQTAEAPLPWLQALNHPALLKALLPSLKGQTSPLLRQHLLLLYQYVLISHGQNLDAPTRNQLFEILRPYLTHGHWPTRLQAADIWLMHRKHEALPQLKALLESSVPAERALALVHYQRWLADPALKKMLPPIPAQSLLNWTQQADQAINELRTWTFHPLFRTGQSPPATLHAFLGQWLATSPPDTVKMAENSLLLLLKHPHPDLRSYALRRMAMTGNPAYAPRIEALFSDPDPAVRLLATESLTQLQKMVPLQYLASLRDPNNLPADTPARIRSLMSSPEHRVKLLDPAYRHLGRQPVFLEELWNMLQSVTDPELQLKGLQALKAAPATWPLSKLAPLLEAGQDVRVRNAALSLALQRNYSQELGTLLRPLLRDPQPELPLEILNYLFRIGALPDTRNLMQLLADRADQRIDRRLLSFDGAQATAPLDDYIGDRLDDWIEAADRKGATLHDWLNWIRDPGLPSPWRRAILRLVGDEGRSASLIPMLRAFVQDPDLSFDAEFALNALEARLGSSGW